jgi:hypothetical protein
MKLKRSSKSEDSLSTTTLSCPSVTRKGQMKIKTKFGLLASCLIFASATYSMAQGHSTHNSENGPAVQEHPSSAKLVQLVRAGTKQFLDVNNATAAGYATLLGCVAGTDHGAMGVHYVNATLLSNLTLDPAQPQALIYEPSNGKMTLVGVEFILDSASWLAANDNTPPVLDGQVFNFVDAPNRFNIPSFFELHVWAWRDNPQGAFVDWNNHVTCAGE